ncbi:MAG: hypothetical protein J6Y92_10710 [Lentisphaeria bacterium]|nr:hypothetical protein [Lentisphaeria bacterium]
MKQNRFRTLWGMLLGAVLLAAAIPFAVRAQSDAPKEVTLTIEASVGERAFFVFTKDTIQYRASFDHAEPSGVTVDGKPWADLSKPFQLDYTPDFEKAVIREKEGRGTIEVATLPNQFVLKIDDQEKTLSPYKVTIAVKNQVPPSTSWPGWEEQSVSLDRPRSSAAARQPAGRTASAQETKTSAEQKNEANASSARAATDPPPGQISTDFPSWLAMMQASASHWDEPTGGTPHPRSRMGSGHDVSYATIGRVPKGHQRVRLTISAVVDRAARFEIIKNKIYYRPFHSDSIAGASGLTKIDSLEGNYPSGVTVNSKEWTNLREPLELSFTPDLEALNGLYMDCGDISFSCRYGDEPGNRSYSCRLVLEVFNKGPKPSPAQIVLSTTALPNEDVKDPDDFEHNPFTVRAVVDEEATFIFGKGQIRFVPGKKGKQPTNVSVDGRSWDRLGEPFNLRYRLLNPEIVEIKGRDTATLTRKPARTYSYKPGDEDEFELVIKDKYSNPAVDLYEITIDSRKADPIQNQATSFMQRNSAPNDPADFEAGRFVLKGTFFGQADFVFEGNEVRYLHNNKCEDPAGVTIDGKSWDDLKKPFRLNASPLKMAHPDILEIQGPYSAYLRHVNDNRLEVTFKLTSSLTGDQLRLTLAPRKKPLQPSTPGNGR